MRLQKQLSRKVKGKKYPKYVLTISPKHVEELGWKKGTELEVAISDNKLIVREKQGDYKK
jgi:formylmethanofuran dehydrogenase subunit D